MAVEDVDAMNHTHLESINPFHRLRSVGPRAPEVPGSGPLALWELHRADEDLLCATVFTAYGCALALALSGELIHLELEASAERLVQKAERLERRLLGRGWTRVGTH